MDYSTVHLRYDGETFDVPYEVLDIPENPSDDQLKLAVERERNMNEGTLDEYEVEKYESTGGIVIRPNAKFG